jgi:pimeloyl-ACP methyl ester carboxylesterase
MLAMLTYGEPTALPPLLIVHGLFGSARNWGVISRRMSETRRVVAVDMRNHGESFWADSHTYPDLAADLAQVIRAEGRPMDVLGHSMGGKAAMWLALTQGQLVNRLVVGDIAPVAYGHSQNHLIAAMRGLDLSGVSLRSEADRRLAATVADAGTRAFLLQSLDLKSEPPRWRLNLDVLEAGMAGIIGWPGSDRQHAGPALFLSGSASSYVRPEHHAPIARMFPDARFQQIEGAGHWLHAERPREFEAALLDFLC